MQVPRRERTTQIREDLGWMDAIDLGCSLALTGQI